MMHREVIRTPQNANRVEPQPGKFYVVRDICACSNEGYMLATENGKPDGEFARTLTMWKDDWAACLEKFEIDSDRAEGIINGVYVEHIVMTGWLP